MAPLGIEVYADNKWKPIGKVKPTDQPGSMSDNKDGRREVYIFQCAADDSGSTIYRSKLGADAEFGPNRELLTTGLEVVKELKKGDQYEKDFNTDISPELRRIRFTHL